MQDVICINHTYTCIFLTKYLFVTSCKQGDGAKFRGYV